MNNPTCPPIFHRDSPPMAAFRTLSERRSEWYVPNLQICIVRNVPILQQRGENQRNQPFLHPSSAIGHIVESFQHADLQVRKLPLLLQRGVQSEGLFYTKHFSYRTLHMKDRRVRERISRKYTPTWQKKTHPWYFLPLNILPLYGSTSYVHVHIE